MDRVIKCNLSSQCITYTDQIKRFIPGRERGGGRQLSGATQVVSALLTQIDRLKMYSPRMGRGGRSLGRWTKSFDAPWVFSALLTHTQTNSKGKERGRWIKPSDVIQALPIDERVIFWLQRIRSLPCACAYVALFARRLAYDHYAIAHAYNAANAHAQGSDRAHWSQKSYSLFEGNQSIVDIATDWPKSKGTGLEMGWRISGIWCHPSSQCIADKMEQTKRSWGKKLQSAFDFETALNWEM